MTSETHKTWFRLTAVMCSALLVPVDIRSQQTPPAPAAPATTDAPAKKTPDQLDSLVAPLALYPDPLLAQVLAASTYPLEIVQCRRWFQQNPNLKGEELTKAAQKQPWDPSVQALVAFPDALKLLDENLQWTTDLGDAFLEDQSGVMDAVQRMRKKAKDGGKLESSKEQKVEVTTVEQKTVIEIKPADPQVIYVPSYNPTVVYGPPVVYAYPPVVYPPPPSVGYVAATAAISFGVGVAMGAMWSGCCHGGYGWGCGWGGGNVNANININNNFNTRYGYNNIQGGNRTNIQGGNRVNNIGSGNSSWQHNPSHRKSVPYSSQNTAQRFGGSSRTDGGLNRGGQNRAGQGRGAQAGTRDLGGGRGGAQAGTRDLGGGRSGAQAGTRDLGGGQDRVGNRSVQSHDRSGSAFGGGESRARAETSSNRGHSSARSSSSFGGGGGGGGRSFGGGGGGGRGGGGRRR